MQATTVGSAPISSSITGPGLATAAMSTAADPTSIRGVEDAVSDFAGTAAFWVGTGQCPLGTVPVVSIKGVLFYWNAGPGTLVPFKSGSLGLRRTIRNQDALARHLKRRPAF